MNIFDATKKTALQCGKLAYLLFIIRGIEQLSISSLFLILLFKENATTPLPEL